jgi:hypothetical protein
MELLKKKRKGEERHNQRPRCVLLLPGVLFRVKYTVSH